MMNDNIPSHVAIIMDGNGRWAKKRHQPRIFGHRAGRDAIERTLRACSDAGVNTLSLFAFSNENWSRSAIEVNLLMELILYTMKQEQSQLLRENVRFKVIGRRDRLSKRLRQQIEKSEKATAACDGITLITAIDYSGQWSMVAAAQNIAAKVAAGELQAKDIDATTFAAARPMPDLPAVDLLIRTSGELRLSNYYLWEMAYGELYFSDTLWPDFGEQDIELALQSYAKRSRRFGGLRENC